MSKIVNYLLSQPKALLESLKFGRRLLFENEGDVRQKTLEKIQTEKDARDLHCLIDRLWKDPDAIQHMQTEGGESIHLVS